MTAHRLAKNSIALTGGAIVGLYLIVILVSLFWLPFNPVSMDTKNVLSAPSLATGHLFGTDEFGRDILSRIMKGC